MVSRVLKVRYFSRWDILNAMIGNNPSYAWCSIWNSRTLLKEGLRWCVGNGTQIKVWNESWLHDALDLEIQTPQQLNLDELRVCDLMISNERMWDMNKLMALFAPSDVEAILRIPLLDNNLEDNLVWHYNNNGLYTVRFGYRLFTDHFMDMLLVTGICFGN